MNTQAGLLARQPFQSLHHAPVRPHFSLALQDALKPMHKRRAHHRPNIPASQKANANHSGALSISVVNQCVTRRGTRCQAQGRGRSVKSGDGDTAFEGESTRDPASLVPLDADEEAWEAGEGVVRAISRDERIRAEARKMRDAEEERLMKLAGGDEKEMQRLSALLEEEEEEEEEVEEEEVDEEEEEEEDEEEEEEEDGVEFAERGARAEKEEEGEEDVYEDAEDKIEDEEGEVEEEEEEDEDEEDESLSAAVRQGLSEEVVEGEEEAEGGLPLNELLEEAGVTVSDFDGDMEMMITGLTSDSRQVQPGDLFLCLAGSTTDGHEFVPQAAERGAAAILLSRSDVSVDERVPAVVLTQDTGTVVSPLAAAFYGRPSSEVAVVGITGTNGKTTTSFLAKAVLEATGVKTGLIGTISYRIGDREVEATNTTPDAITTQRLLAEMRDEECGACVMEVSSHALSLGRVDDVSFRIALFTNLTRDHLDFHPSMDDYRAAKGRLFQRMQDPELQRIVVNLDDPNAEYFISQAHPEVPLISYSLEDDRADVYALEVTLSLFETELLVRTPRGDMEISSGLLGRHNVSNMLAAIALGLACNAPLESIAAGIEEVDAVPGRAELVDEGQSFAVVVDYAHTPDALERLLDTLRECGARRLITVVGCGGDRDRGKRPMMAKIATEKSEVVILTADNPRTEDPMFILDDMLAGVGWSMEEYLEFNDAGFIPPLPSGSRLFVHDVRGIAVRAAVAMAEDGDAVVIAGKGHETYQIVGTEKSYFDDREECREALQHVEELRQHFYTSQLPWRILDMRDMKVIPSSEVI